MNVGRAFRRLAFGQVLLGIVTFCLVEPNPALLLIAGAVGLLAWYVTEGPAARGLPRWAVNIGALLSVAWLVVDLQMDPSRMVIAMGHFIMALQILMLYMKKGNREYAQLLVLSLLQMVGGSVLPGGVNMIFGVLLVVYSVLGLLTVLTFHFKTTADTVREAQVDAAPEGMPVRRQAPTLGRGYRWQLRLIAVAIGGICAATAVIIFVMVPRSGGSHLSPELNRPGEASRVGFNDRVQLGGRGIGSASTEAVLNLEIRTADGASLGSESQGWLMRGAALDYYDPQSRTWLRSPGMVKTDVSLDVPDAGLPLADAESSGPWLKASVTLRQAGHDHLFTVTPLNGPVAMPTDFDSNNVRRVRFSPDDQQLTAAQRSSGAAVYALRWPLRGHSSPSEVYQHLRKQEETSDPEETAPSRRSPSTQPAATAPAMPATAPRRERGSQGIDDRRFQDIEERAMSRRERWQLFRRRRGGEPSRALQEPDLIAWPVQEPRVKAMAMSILQARFGDDLDNVSKFEKARALEDHLRSNYRYSLDTGSTSEDPVIEFLFTGRRGHCELFASGLVALCRTVEIPARVITGYRVSEYNPMSEYYVVRRANAHAWVEIDAGEAMGWRTLDATPPDLVAAEHAGSSAWWLPLRQLYEHIEYTWIRSVVAYDNRTRTALLQRLNREASTALSPQTYGLPSFTEAVRRFSTYWRFDQIAVILAGFILVVIGVAMASLARLIWIRRQKVAALQLANLPRSTRRALARRLRFYLHMIEMLERHGLPRPAWQSPYGFARELAEANPMRFDPVVALTEHFYEIRFGRRPMDDKRRKLIRAHLRQLEMNLSRRSDAA